MGKQNRCSFLICSVYAKQKVYACNVLMLMYSLKRGSMTINTAQIAEITQKAARHGPCCTEGCLVNS